MANQKKLPPGARAKTIAVKNAAAQFAELRRICDEFDNLSADEVTPELLARWGSDVEFASQGIQKVWSVWVSLPTPPSDNPVVTEMIDKNL